MNTPNNKTGLIYCPKHVIFHSPEKRWNKIAQSLQRHGIEYDLIQSESQASVERLVNMLIHNGYETIIIVGGDSALNDAVNCLMRTEHNIRERITLGVIPNGLMNNFASFWGLTDSDIDMSCRSIANHRIRKIDSGSISYTDKQGARMIRYFLNGINIGLIADIERIRRKTRHIFFSRKISYIVSLLLILFHRKDYQLQYTINFEEEERKTMTLCIGNAPGYGQTPNAVPYNGMLDISVVCSSPFTQLFSCIALYLRGKILNHKSVVPYRSRDIEVVLPIKKDVPVTVDGREISISNRHTDIKAAVNPETINFIIPGR